MQNVLFRSKLLKLFFSALPHICIRARENREYYNGWHFERTVEKGKQDSCFSQLIMDSVKSSLNLSPEYRWQGWLLVVGKAVGCGSSETPSSLGVNHSPLGRRPLHSLRSSTSKQRLEQDEGDRTHPSRPMRQPDRSKGVNH